ncbi:uncharacterized protein SPSK_01273 [Sporothrix schenckii 1099-18]|uniref:Uncharacterized protein n=1 Tax=Sporothrix schenckii 1099-18 TaxID=1397361 RepID=A0A0F2LZZ1_SPOSC|nr:uncharacterized protein SPSK_01273 [Sporothrix schenckii 1099-18]KJR81461.1 hypothetical protein SPSK_01273 [Sporothrix schenckii 1099-18]
MDMDSSVVDLSSSRLGARWTGDFQRTTDHGSRPNVAQIRRWDKMQCQNGVRQSTGPCIDAVFQLGQPSTERDGHVCRPGKKDKKAKKDNRTRETSDVSWGDNCFDCATCLSDFVLKRTNVLRGAELIGWNRKEETKPPSLQLRKREQRRNATRRCGEACAAFVCQKERT